MKNKKISQTRVIQVLKACNGHQFRAAKKLGITAATIINYRKEFPLIEEAYRTAKGLIGDMAESKLMAAIKKGEAWAICFYLKTQCRDRGYIERADYNVNHTAEMRVAGRQLEEVKADIVKRLTHTGTN